MSHKIIGSGKEITIKELAKKIKKIVYFKGEIKFDKTKLNGTLRKLTNIGRLAKIGFKNKIDLEEGLKRAYMDFKERNSTQN